MIRLALHTAEGKALSLNLYTSDDAPPNPRPMGSALMLRSPHARGNALPPGHRVLAAEHPRRVARTSSASVIRDIKRLADSVVGWEHVRMDGEPIACTRSLVVELLRSAVIREQVTQALHAYGASGILA